MAPIRRTERILGLSPRPCRSCRPASARLVTRRRWALELLGVPLVALDARWRRCTGCARRFAMPRLSLATVVTASMLIAFLMGLGLVAYGALFAWALVLLFWAVWLGGFGLDAALDRRLVPVPAALYRPARPIEVKSGPRRRALESAARRRPVTGWRRQVRWVTVPVRLWRGYRAVRRATRPPAPGAP